MEEKFKKESKFVDNVAYKSKFQFLIWVNNNVICQRYFKINGFNEESVYTEEFSNCMNGIVDSIQDDLKSKSRVFMWYTNMTEPMKIRGFLNDEEVEKYGDSFLGLITDPNVSGEIVAPDGKTFNKEYIQYAIDETNEYGEIERPKDGEFVFKFSFLIDDVPVFERIWDGNVYPKFVRNGVDLTNNYASYDTKDASALSFGAAIIRYMQKGKTNLISDFIRRICETLSNTFTEKYEYTKEMSVYGINNKIDKERYDAATSFYGVVKPVVTGHTDISEKSREYDYLSAFETYKQSWKKAVRKKTQEYFETLYPSNRQIENIDKRY